MCAAWVGSMTVVQYTVAQGLGLETILWILSFSGVFMRNFRGVIGHGLELMDDPEFYKESVDRPGL